MKTFLIYSKKPLNFISSVKDISNLCFVKYGFNWVYAVDIINIFYSLIRKMYVLAMICLAIYLLFSENIILYSVLIISFAFIAYALEICFLKQRKYVFITSIEAKNVSEAKKTFVEQYILPNKNIIL